MYVPHFNAMSDQAQARALVASVGAAQLVTVGRDGVPLATLLPVLWEGDRVIAHMARANPHWTHIEQGDPVLLVVTGPQAYVSPTWYASKAEHGRVVPTWNYLSAHVYGELVFHHDPVWLEAVVRRLTDRHEAERDHPWSIDDAPRDYIDSQLKAIVGVELTITRVEAKAKLGVQRSAEDVDGVIRGLAERGDVALAALTARGRPRPASPAAGERPGTADGATPH